MSTKTKDLHKDQGPAPDPLSVRTIQEAGRVPGTGLDLILARVESRSSKIREPALERVRDGAASGRLRVEHMARQRPYVRGRVRHRERAARHLEHGDIVVPIADHGHVLARDAELARELE